MLPASASNPTNNPNHPIVRCVDGVEFGGDGPYIHADDPNAMPPYRVFDILNQVHVGPEFPTKVEAQAYMTSLGGAEANP